MSRQTRAAACFAAGVRHQAAGRVPQGIRSFLRVLARQPDCAAAWVNLGLLREADDDPEAAVPAYQAALALAPRLYEAALNLGVALTLLRRCEAAEAACRQALALRPHEPAAWSNLGALLGGLHRDAEAEAACRQALALAPEHRGAQFNLAYVLLRRGAWAEGWRGLENRAGLARFQQALSLPRWHGEALHGRRLLVVSDAAHGDMIQMARYATVLRTRGAGPLGVCAQAALRRLLAQNAGWDVVLGPDDPLSTADWDLWAPAMSLPHLCQTRIDNVPDRLPYLHAEPARRAQRRAQLQAAGAGDLQVGLVWRGNPGNPNDASRSLPGLHSLAGLAGLTGVRFISLQFGPGADEALSPPPGLTLEILATPLGDFADTAAVVANLDLVIAVDTSIVHLAGALGVPAWVLLPHFQTDSRWLDDRTDTPWYPGVLRLFRQTQVGDWAPVLSAVVVALQAAVAQVQAGGQRPTDFGAAQPLTPMVCAYNCLSAA